jgi:tetratricopeptide (TPR) repeat protein
MSRKHKNGNHPGLKAVSGVSGARPPETEVLRIRELIVGRHSKTGVELAKDLHKRVGTTETEALLLDAYQCRIEDLLRLGMAVEAKALLQMVGERFPRSGSWAVGLQREIAVVDGRLDEIVAPLQDANLAPEVQERIETFVRQRVHDLPALAAVSCLPPKHPLREAAAALAAAFRAVTRGPVDDRVVALPEVSRRSPLAPWKALIRAIASFYRREDDVCRTWLQAVPKDSAPARLVRPLMAMMGADATADFNGAEQRLMAAAGDGSAALRPALAALEVALAAKKHRALLDAARDAVAICGQRCPGIRERLRQHIVVRSLSRGVSRDRICAAIGGTPREDAYFWRLLARSLEHSPDLDFLADAVFHWERFRREAIREKWFAAGSLEDGVLSLHMARIAERLPLDSFDEFGYVRSLRRDRSVGGLGDEDLRSPEMLYERACQADPHPDAFQTWLNWADRQGGWKAADHVAELWRQALPGDTKPLLHLMESAEKRGAYRKSLQYLEDAEELDRLNPEVRRAKLRLLLAAAVRHLKQHKARLAMAEIERIEALPEVREGEIAALAAAMRFLCATLDRDMAAMQAQREHLNALLGSAVPAFVLTKGLAQAANLDSEVELPPLVVSDFSGADLLLGMTRAVALGDWAGLPLALPPGWEKPLIAALDRPECPIDVTQMLVLGEAALRSGYPKLSYAVSVAGLANGAADARFLFLRGRALPAWQPQRRDGCFTAALELARRERNLQLTGKILDQMRDANDSYWGFDFIDDPASASRPLASDLLNEILEEERAEKQFPAPGRNRPPMYGSKLESINCDCPNCRARRGEPVGDRDGDRNTDDFAEDDKFDETIDQLEEVLDRLPPQIARKMEAAIARGEPPEMAVARILGNVLPETESPWPERKAKKRTGKLPPPEQSNLF